MIWILRHDIVMKFKDLLKNWFRRVFLNPNPSSTVRLSWIAVWLIVFGIVASWFAASFSEGESRGAARASLIVTDLACCGLGFLIGFLFGVPKVLQGAVTEIDKQRYELRINTNLEQISDWLTKILVGVGLVELKNVAPWMWSIATGLSQSFGENGAVAPAVIPIICASLVYFSSIGFLVGYLITRLYFTEEFARTDRRIITGEVEDPKEASEKNTPFAAAAGVSVFSSSARKILATLAKYQKEHFKDKPGSRWTFCVPSDAPDYPEFAKGLVELVQDGLVFVSQDTRQAGLTDKGLTYVETHAGSLAGIPVYGNFRPA